MLYVSNGVKANQEKSWGAKLPVLEIQDRGAAKGVKMRYPHRKASRKTRKHSRKHLTFLEALRLYAAMPM